MNNEHDLTGSIIIGVGHLPMGSLLGLVIERRHLLALLRTLGMQPPQLTILLTQSW